MDATSLHLAVNHLPIVGALLGLALVVLAAARRAEVHTVQAATLVLALAAGGGIAAYVSGEEAEHAAEEAGLDHDAIEAHEDSAKPALIALLAATAVGVGLSVQGARGRAIPVAGTAAWVLLTLISAGMMTGMGLTGRALGHPERYGDAPAAGAASGATQGASEGAAAH